MSDELKPCPFCGGKPTFVHATSEDIGNGYVCRTLAVISCDHCMFDMTGETDEKAAAAWNARAAVTDEQFSLAVHDGRVWQAVRECHAVLKSKLCYLPDDPPEVDEFHECSECGEVFPYGPEGYCPRCGAKVAAVGIMRLVTLYDEEGAEGIECSKCGWSEIHGWDESMPGHCPGCGAKVVG